MKRLGFVVLVLILLFPLTAPSAEVSDGSSPRVMIDTFFSKIDAYLKASTGDDPATLYEVQAINLPLGDTATAHGIQGRGWYSTVFADESGGVRKVKGQIPVTSGHVDFYHAIVFALSEHESKNASLFLFTPEGKNAIKINFNVSGYERIMTFVESEASSEMSFTFEHGVRKTFRFLEVGTYKVGDRDLLPGEYYATSVSNDSSLRIYRNRKLVKSFLLNKNADTDGFLLFEGDVIEVGLSKAFLVPTK